MRNFGHPAAIEPAPYRSRWTLSMALAVLFVLTEVSPYLRLIGSGFRASWVIYVIWLIAALVENQYTLNQIRTEASNRRGELIALGLWAAVIFVNAVLGRGYTGINHVMAVINLGMIVSMELFYSAQGDGRSAGRLIITAVILLLGIEAARSIATMQAEPWLVRDATASIGGAQQAEYIASMGIGSYSLYTGFAIAMPCLLWSALQWRGILRVLLLTACIVIAYVIGLTSLLGAALLLSAGFVLFTLLTFVLRGSRLGTLLVLILIALFIGGIWFYFIQDTVQGQFVADRLAQQVTGMTEYGLEGDPTGRVGLAEASFNTFFENPAFGIGPVTGTINPAVGVYVGGHSSLFDLLAQYGLVGFLCYAVFFFGVCRRGLTAYRRDRTSMALAAHITVCCLFALGGIYNPVVFLPEIETLFFFLCLAGGRATVAGQLEALPVASSQSQHKSLSADARRTVRR